MTGDARKAAVVTTAQKWTVNPLFRLLTRLGVAPGYAVVETTGRKTGKRRRVPVANGTSGDEFWVVAEQGRRAAWVLNVEANPRVRVLAGRRWRTGAAELLPDDTLLPGSARRSRPGTNGSYGRQGRRCSP